MKAWGEAVDKLHSEAAKVTAARRTDVDAAVKQMKADAVEAEARLQKLKQVGSESWAAQRERLAAPAAPPTMPPSPPEPPKEGTDERELRDGASSPRSS